MRVIVKIRFLKIKVDKKSKEKLEKDNEVNLEGFRFMLKVQVTTKSQKIKLIMRKR